MACNIVSWLHGIFPITGSDRELCIAFESIAASCCSADYYETIWLIYQFYEQRHLLFYTYIRSTIFSGHGNVIAVKNQYVFEGRYRWQYSKRRILILSLISTMLHQYLCSVLLGRVYFSYKYNDSTMGSAILMWPLFYCVGIHEMVIWIKNDKEFYITYQVDFW